jgi:hypothetical protein
MRNAVYKNAFISQYLHVLPRHILFSFGGLMYVLYRHSTIRFIIFQQQPVATAPNNEYTNKFPAEQRCAKPDHRKQQIVNGSTARLMTSFLSSWKESE